MSVSPLGAVPVCGTDPASLEAWHGPFGYAEHWRKILLASCRETERARHHDEKITEARLDDLARTSEAYISWLIVSLEAASGTLALVTNPAGLTVVIDGQEQTRKTPANFTLPVGEHRVEVNRGGEKQGFAVDIRDGVISQKSIDWGP